MSVKIRMKQLGRRNRPFFRICVVDVRGSRDGRMLEELGSYDPLVPDVDARVVLNGERINHWLGVGAQPSDKVKVLIKKYGAAGTHLAKQEAARTRLAQPKEIPPMAEPVARPKTKGKPEESAPAEAAPAEAAASEPAATETAEAAE